MKSVVKLVHPNRMSEKIFWEFVKSIYTVGTTHMTDLIQSRVEIPVGRAIDIRDGLTDELENEA
jgi:hypothetical protein